VGDSPVHCVVYFCVVVFPPFFDDYLCFSQTVEYLGKPPGVERWFGLSEQV
jgi:hypothetical protein